MAVAARFSLFRRPPQPPGFWRFPIEDVATCSREDGVADRAGVPSSQLLGPSPPAITRCGNKPSIWLFGIDASRRLRVVGITIAYTHDQRRPSK